MKGMAMKENDLTYELICAAVNGEKTALEEILRFYDDYINALATVKGEDAQGIFHSDSKASISSFSYM